MSEQSKQEKVATLNKLLAGDVLDIAALQQAFGELPVDATLATEIVEQFVSKVATC